MPNPDKAVILDDAASAVDPSILMLDNLLNIASGLGLGKQEQDHWTQSFLNFDFEQLETAFRSDWVARKVVSIVPQDMSYNWRRFNGTLESDQIDDIQGEENRLDIKDKFRLAQQWARLYGTSYLVLDVAGTGEPHTELKWNQIKEGSLRGIKVFDRRWMRYNGMIVTDPFDEDYGLPLLYSVGESAVRIHHSRILRFEGDEIPLMQFRENQYCSDSVLVGLEKAIKHFQKASQSAGAVVDEASVDVIKIKGLFDALGDKEAEKSLRGHIRNLKAVKSLHNMTVLDAEDEYENVASQAITGLDSLMKAFLEHVAIAVDIPVTRFLNSTPGGLNAGEDNASERKYAEKIEAEQTRKWGANLRILDILMSLNLGLTLDFDNASELNKALAYEWVSIIPDDPLGDEEEKSKWIDNCQKLLDMGILDELTIAKELDQKGWYSQFTQDQIDEIETEVEEAAKLAEAVKNQTGTDDPPDPDNDGAGDTDPDGAGEPVTDPPDKEDDVVNAVEDYRSSLNDTPSLFQLAGVESVNESGK